MTIYSTKVSAHYIARRAAAQAGGAEVNFLLGTLVVGDGNGAVPSISDLVAAGHVLHQVWSGNVVVAVTVNSGNSAQIDIRCVIPAAIGGVPVGPFWIREFTISDENGVVCVYGTTQIEKTTSGEGATTDVTLIAAIGESDSSVVVLSPSSDYVLTADMKAAINAHQPTAEEPLYAQDTTSGGWLQRLFKIRRATQAPAQLGVERPATDAEFAAGAPAGGSSPWPWPTLAQVKGALDAIAAQIAALTASIAGHAVTHDDTLTGAGTAASPLGAVPQIFGTTWIVTPMIGLYDVASGEAIGVTASAADIIAGTVPGITFVGFTNTIAMPGVTGTWRTTAWVVTDNANNGCHALYWERIA